MVIQEGGMVNVLNAHQELEANFGGLLLPNALLKGPDFSDDFCREKLRQRNQNEIV